MDQRWLWKQRWLELKKLTYNGTWLQCLWFLMLLAIFPVLVPFLREFDKLVQARKAGNPLYLWPQYSDLQIAVLTSISLHIIKVLSIPILKGYLYRLIHPKYQGKERWERAEKAALSLFKGTYFTFAFLGGYLIAKDAFFLNWKLGGSGSIDLMFQDFPYQSTASFPLVRPYLMVQLGYHLFSLISHLSSTPKNDFMEMLLHHTMTVFLITLAYFMNYVAMSHLVLFTHDAGDVFCYFSKLFVDTKYKVITILLAPGVLVSWGYMRLYIFPFDLIRAACYDNPKAEEIYGVTVLGGMLHFLLCLHVYWYLLFIKMIHRAIFLHEVEDLQHQVQYKNQ
jgi:hypothetical protein